MTEEISLEDLCELAGIESDQQPDLLTSKDKQQMKNDLKQLTVTLEMTSELINK